MLLLCWSKFIMALYQKTTKLTELPKKRMLFPAAACGWDDVYYPQAICSIFSAYLRLYIYLFLNDRTY